MDTGQILVRQLKAAKAFAETEADRRQVEWWISKVAELRKLQPAADPVDAQLEFHATPARATGTHGGGR